MSSLIEPVNFVTDHSLVRIVSHVYAKYREGSIQKKFVYTSKELETRYGIRIDPKKIKNKKEVLEQQITNEIDCEESEYDSDSLRDEIIARYPTRISPTSQQTSTKPRLSISSSSSTSSAAVASPSPLGSSDIIKLKASLDRIANSFTSTVTHLQDLQQDVHRIANALCGGERRGIVESIKAVENGTMNLDDSEDDVTDDTESKQTPKNGTLGVKRKPIQNNTASAFTSDSTSVASEIASAIQAEKAKKKKAKKTPQNSTDQ